MAASFLADKTSFGHALCCRDEHTSSRIHLTHIEPTIVVKTRIQPFEEA
jgi:hypothetical protein